MKLKINFGTRTAILHCGEKCAKLNVFNAQTLPLALADAMDKMDGIDVDDVRKLEGDACIRFWHDRTPSDLAALVCEIISHVYNTDVAVYHV